MASPAAPPFLIKTYAMVDDPGTDDTISWNESGTAFVVWRRAEFERDLLPRNFKHSNFASFVRQLNTYGFKKVGIDRWEFANDCFRRGQKHLLGAIQRRKGIGAGLPAPAMLPTAIPISPTPTSSSGDPAVSSSPPPPPPPGLPAPGASGAMAELEEENAWLRRENARLARELARAASATACATSCRCTTTAGKRGRGPAGSRCCSASRSGARGRARARMGTRSIKAGRTATTRTRSRKTTRGTARGGSRRRCLGGGRSRRIWTCSRCQCGRLRPRGLTGVGRSRTRRCRNLWPLGSNRATL